MIKNTIEEITNKILDIERRYELLVWKIDGVFVWQSARVIIYTKIQELLDPYIIKPKKIRLIDILIKIYHRIIINSLFYNPFLDLKKCDTLVFESSRKYLVDDEYIDIYTKYLCDELGEKKILFQKYQSNYTYDKISKNRENTYHLDFIILLSKLVSKFIKVNINDVNKQKISKLENEFACSFNIKIDLQAIFEKEIKRFKTQYPLYNKLFSRKKAKEVYIVNFSEKAPLIFSAKNYGATIIELQHGLMVKEDLIFHFPYADKGSVEYFPDKFLIWDENINTSILPILKNQVSTCGYKFLDNRINKYKDVVKIKQILVISQRTLTSEIARFVKVNMSKFINYQIIYKLHSDEEELWRKIPELKQLTEFNNVKVVGNSHSIYKLLAESQYVIGVYSTAVYEATKFKCIVILLNLPGVEMIKQLIDNKTVIMVSDSTDDLLCIVK